MTTSYSSGEKTCEGGIQKARIGKWYSFIEDILAYLSSLIIFTMMVMTVIDVLARVFMGKPIAGIYELLEFSLPAAAFLGMIYLQRVRGHIVVSFIAERLSDKTREWLDLMSLVLALPIFMLITWQTWLVAKHACVTGDTTTGLVEYPLGPIKTIISIGCGLLCIRMMLQIGEIASRVLRKEHG